VRLAPGLWGVLATPFTDALDVDHVSLGRLARHYARVGATGRCRWSPA